MYGHIEKVLDHPAAGSGLEDLIEKFGRDNAQLAGTKSKPVAWFVSNCNADSKREDYVKELQKHIQARTYFLFRILRTVLEQRT
jgi:hypothetical protein